MVVWFYDLVVGMKEEVLIIVLELLLRKGLSGMSYTEKEVIYALATNCNVISAETIVKIY